MKKYTVTYEIDVYAERPSDAIARAGGILPIVVERHAAIPPDAWDRGFVGHTGAMTGEPHEGEMNGWRCMARVVTESGE